MMLRISVGIMAYNEESNIGRLLESLLNQKLTSGNIVEIFVVASGCTDKTEEIVREFIKQDNRITLLVQAKREGKASAINLFLTRAAGDIIILESADTVPETNTVEQLVAPFINPQIGMTGAHPIPVNSKKDFIGFTVHLMWELHHQIALTSPKLGELVAFRNIIKGIPIDTAVDEASIEALILEAGYKLHYAPEAIVYNKGPENIRDFIRQRRRIAAGHRYLCSAHNYIVTTSSPKKILNTLFRYHSWGLRDTVWTLGAISLEIIGRMLGYYDFCVRRENPFIWDIASTTKNLH